MIQSDHGFSIEVRKIDYLLETEIGKTTSKKCGHQLGDSNCKVNLSNYTQNSAISSINSNFDFIINGTYADGIFNRGWIKFTAGANAGLTRDISYNNGGQIVTFQPFPHQINIGDSVEVVQGCDKTLYTCVTTVKIYLNNVESVKSWTVDYRTGILTFDVPLLAGTIINASFEFDIPVWFENDKFSWTLEGYQKDPQTEKVVAIYRSGNLPVQEQNSPSFTLVSFRSCSSRI